MSDLTPLERAIVRELMTGTPLTLSGGPPDMPEWESTVKSMRARYLIDLDESTGAMSLPTPGFAETYPAEAEKTHRVMGWLMAELGAADGSAIPTDTFMKSVKELHIPSERVRRAMKRLRTERFVKTATRDGVQVVKDIATDGPRSNPAAALQRTRAWMAADAKADAEAKKPKPAPKPAPPAPTPSPVKVESAPKVESTPPPAPKPVTTPAPASATPPKPRPQPQPTAAPAVSAPDLRSLRNEVVAGLNALHAEVQDVKAAVGAAVQERVLTNRATPESVMARVAVLLLAHGPMTQGDLSKGHLSSQQRELLGAALRRGLEADVFAPVPRLFGQRADRFEVKAPPPGTTWDQLHAEAARVAARAKARELVKT
ncbi:Uncharacterised protein [Mycobacteroides abscessus subsp. massiliense]|uniref:hypothetical protein n=1 Tax=Mycobacteroides abscessus TaxID=36809 RepID=UPI0009A66E4E|nr:hypothetical protein [Mycobacteroides abscessus]MDO3055628.1 hypothetical protein [Mycobacteroides abscessus subsp. massiliense]SLC38036.1 Uncharacterised protein [Mycobacteroides abscessus subsp. massiliense]SLH30456.1 Uncharacterised protein [Mycobacteroides abscessus subsp. massiliense]SLI03504.1 Uncharacterised protein [Mycobacteroides abscessus subsp. massiliense]